MRPCLAKFIPNSMDVERVKREAWNEERILVLTPEQQAKLTNKEFEVVINIGNRVYGGRNEQKK